MADFVPTNDELIGTIRWLAEQMGLEPDPEDGVWLATKMGRVLRLPAACDAALAELLNDGVDNRG